ncbi:sulfatase family protein [Alienimonas chondri]|uniref:Arylsulfatase n=1 Tax=Alienimonas chondri TaxID=2681879 RepID=A0ABX1VHJ4_9PLAN|nr:sulfatase-like hydrolase/transferase [Alienimonas chondri]NNJ27274.1 Arylsulfatase [Alienimonas chondri]
MLASLLLVACAASVEPPPPPNVVVMMADDLGWGDVGYHESLGGSPEAFTPHLDAMAQAGVRLERFYSASPVCSPTRASVMTGRHPHRIGVTNANAGHLPDEEEALGERLRDAGYATGFFGKWHLGTLTAERRDANRGRPGNTEHLAPPWEHGFAETFATESKVPTYDPLWKPPTGPYKTWWEPIDDPAFALPYGTAYWTGPNQDVKELRGDDSDLIVDRAEAFIEREAHAGRPFFAVIWFHAPHLPVVAGEEDAARFAHLSDYEKHYRGSVAALDDAVGRVRATLRDAGVAENTLVTFCSDNGPEGNTKAPGSAGPLRGRKRDLYEGGVRVPGLIEWPAGGLPNGEATTFPAVTTDLFPTVLAAVGLEPPTDAGRDGVNLLPALRAGETLRDRPIGFVYQSREAWTGDRYKLVRTGRDRPWELYDLQTDPAEADDLAAEQPDRTREMAAAFTAWRATLPPAK